MSRKDGVVLLLSIKPKFASKIYDGSKNIELRRVRPARDVGRVLIYETAPIKRVTGWFTLRWIRSLSPSRAWAKYRKHLGVSRKTFRAYYQACHTAVLFAVLRVRRLGSAIRLCSLPGAMRPPQSYKYLERKLAKAIR